MKKKFVIATSLISQMVHLGQASAQTANQDLHDKLTDYLNEEAQKPAAGNAVSTYQGDSSIVVIKKLRSPFRHISKKLFATKLQATSSSEVQPPTSSSDPTSSSSAGNIGQGTSSSTVVNNPPTSSTVQAPAPNPTSSTENVGPTSSTSNPPPPVATSSSGPETPTSSSSNPPPTSSSGPCSVRVPMKAKNFISSYHYQVMLKSVAGNEAGNKAPYYFANKIRQSENAIVYRVFQFAKLSDLSHPTAQAYLVVNPKTHQVTFSHWTK